MPTAQRVRVVAFHDDDYDQVIALSPRLSLGVAAWRDPEKVLAGVRSWVDGSIASAGEDGHAVFVAKLDDRVVGFVTAEQRHHWSGDADAYVGELVTAEDVEGSGVGRALMDAAERWARQRDLAHLTLETGAGNSRARGFYRHLGYEDEDVRLTKRLAE
jgi:ribosomal protein S18 acetylase RimI-like enzyme